MLFKDKAFQTELEKNGFIIIPFLNTQELSALNQFYKDIHQDQEPPLFIENIHMTSWCQDPDYKKNISSMLETVFTPATQRFFENVRCINHVFIVKRSGQQTAFKVHQDWNVVDETSYQSVNVWVPLHDVDESSGALWIVKGSHKINRPIRGAGYLFPDYSSFTDELEKAAVSIRLKAGQAIVFFHSVIHGSPPNLANKNREAACFSVIPKEAPLRIYFQKDKASKLEQHQPADDFMFKYNSLRTDTFTTPPTQNPVVAETPFINKPVTKEEIFKAIDKKNYFWEFWK
jgi:hypothetical protein